MIFGTRFETRARAIKIARTPLTLLLLTLLASAGGASAAGIEILDGRRVSGPVSIAEDGALKIGQQRFTWNEVRVARINNSPRLSEALPRGWRIEDIGKVQGSSSETNGAYTLHAIGLPVSESKEGRENLPRDLPRDLPREKRGQSAHYIHRILRSEGGVAARIQSVSGSKDAVAGVMLRENLEGSGGFALIGVSGDGHLRFDNREHTWGETRSRDLGPVMLPVWVKVVRNEKDESTTVHRSTDGTHWQQVGQTKLAAKSEPFPEGSDHWTRRFHAGLAATVAGTNQPTTARIELASLNARGLLAEYFSDDSFKSLLFARADTKLDYWWGERAPAPNIEPERYSVRWTGKLQPKQNDNYRFHYDSEGTRLWVNGQELFPAQWNENKNRRDEKVKELPLTGGKQYDIRFEFRKIPGAQAARIGWSSRSLNREVIPPSAYSHAIDARTPDEDGDNTNVFLARGLWLRGGSFLAGEVLTANGSATRFAGATGTPLTILNNRISRLMMRSSRRPIRFELANNRTGLFLRGGDFMEGEFEELDTRSVAISSVLFGRKTFPRDNGPAIAVVLNTFAPQPAPIEVTLLDGSVLRARSVRADGDTVAVDDLTLGKLRVVPAQLQEIRNLSPAVQ